MIKCTIKEIDFIRSTIFPFGSVESDELVLSDEFGEKMASFRYIVKKLHSVGPNKKRYGLVTMPDGTILRMEVVNE